MPRTQPKALCSRKPSLLPSGLSQPWVSSSGPTRLEVFMSGYISPRLEAPGGPEPYPWPSVDRQDPSTGTQCLTRTGPDISDSCPALPLSCVLSESRACSETRSPQLQHSQVEAGWSALDPASPASMAAGSACATSSLEVSPRCSAGHAAWPHGLWGGVWILLGVQGWWAVAEFLDVGEEGAFEAQVGVLQWWKGALPRGRHLPIRHHL